MKRLWNAFLDRVDLAIDDWMINHGGNRERRLPLRHSFVGNDGRMIEDIEAFLQYLSLRSRTDDTPFGDVNPTAHYGARGLDFVSQYLAWHGFKNPAVSHGTFTSSIVAFGLEFSKRRMQLPSFLTALNAELVGYTNATVAQVRGAVHRARVRRQVMCRQERDYGEAYETLSRTVLPNIFSA